jgi:hypothetical protein
MNRISHTQKIGHSLAVPDEPSPPQAANSATPARTAAIFVLLDVIALHRKRVLPQPSGHTLNPSLKKAR